MSTSRSLAMANGRNSGAFSRIESGARDEGSARSDQVRDFRPPMTSEVMSGWTRSAGSCRLAKPAVVRRPLSTHMTSQRLRP